MSVRQAFVHRTVFPSYRVNLADFKGHQAKALARMKRLSPQIDLILELRDARAPISTQNPLIRKVFRDKETMVLYTKRDMSPVSSKMLDELHGDESWGSIDCRSSGDTHKLLSTLRDRYNAMYPRPPLGLRLLIAGMPNVGKSTLVNSLRGVGLRRDGKKKSVARVGSHAGVTRSTSEIIRVSSDPDILLYDTPGVLVPHVRDAKTMLSLSLIGTISKVNQADPVIMADYLLYVMNLADSSGKAYKKFLDHPTNDIYELLGEMARKSGNFKKLHGDDHKRPNYLGAARQLLQVAGSGKLGRLCFDEEALTSRVEAENLGVA